MPSMDERTAISKLFGLDTWALFGSTHSSDFKHARGQQASGIEYPDVDPHVLVAFADQEIAAGRDDHAKTLIAAAYDAFDRRC